MVRNKVSPVLAKIRASGARVTRERKAILAVLRSAERPVTRLHIARIVGQQGVDQSSVYRTLDLFVAQNLVEVFENPNHEQAYELRTTLHHHHLVCEQCGRTENIRCPMPASLLTVLERRHKFHALRHVTSVYGLCDRCFHQLNTKTS